MKLSTETAIDHNRILITYNSSLLICACPLTLLAQLTKHADSTISISKGLQPNTSDKILNGFKAKHNNHSHAIEYLEQFNHYISDLPFRGIDLYRVGSESHEYFFCEN